MSKRPLQLASLIHRAVQSVLAEGLADPRLDAMITITGVKVSPDLRSATIFVSIMPEKAESRALHALTDAARFIRRQAAERIAIHRMPDLRFRIDRSVKKHAQLMAALDEVEQERKALERTNEDKPADNATDGDHQ